MPRNSYILTLLGGGRGRYTMGEMLPHSYTCISHSMLCSETDLLCQALEESSPQPFPCMNKGDNASRGKPRLLQGIQCEVCFQYGPIYL